VLQEWTGSPVKTSSYVENIEQKLGAWIEENGDGEERGGYEEVGNSEGSYGIVGNLRNGYPEVGDMHGVIGNSMEHGGNEEKAYMHEWDVVDDGFDYASLAERLKT
jgi:transcriptional enhancer factor